jgi:cytochrome c peroxidase
MPIQVRSMQRMVATLRFVASAMLAGVILALGAISLPAAPDFDARHWRKVLRRPAEIPVPASNPITPEKVALGARLFDEKRLSGDGTIACSTCHQPELSFSDGIARRKGLDGSLLPRRTPSLWNAAWGLTQFWDGRATTLEAQAAGPIEHPNEMAGTLENAVAFLKRDDSYRAAFIKAFPREVEPVTPQTLLGAISAYERMLVSPATRFDRWVEGDDAALDETEMSGFRLFTGKAGCVACHKSWRFTDDAFHDIGLPLAATPDRGRGAILKLHKIDHAFKTPSLRERLWTAPYMHDGSIGSLDEAVAHYTTGKLINRPNVSPDLDRSLRLDAAERAALVAFIATLSSDEPPRPLALPARTQKVGASGPYVTTGTIGQKDRRFTPGAVTIRAGQALTIINDDTRTHTIRLDDAAQGYSSDAQEPGDKVEIAFPDPGQFAVTCGIHPEMRLDVRVTK